MNSSMLNSSLASKVQKVLFDRCFFSFLVGIRFHGVVREPPKVPIPVKMVFHLKQQTETCNWMTALFEGGVCIRAERIQLSFEI